MTYGIPLSGRARAATGENPGTSSLIGGQTALSRPIINPEGEWLPGNEYAANSQSGIATHGRLNQPFFPSRSTFTKFADQTRTMRETYQKGPAARPLEQKDLGDAGGPAPVTGPVESTLGQLGRFAHVFLTRVVAQDAPADNNAIVGVVTR